MQNKKLDTLQSIELAEGVEVHLRVAGPVARGLAWLIDACVVIGVMILVGLVVSLAIEPLFGEEVSQGVMLLCMFLVTWFYFVYFEAGKKGATPGKRSMKLKVVTPAGAPITVTQAIIRNFLRFVDFLPAAYGVGLVVSLSTKRFQRVGDLVADTVVIYAQVERRMELQLSNEVKPQAPKLALSRDEQQALLLFAERAGAMSPSRRKELAGHAAELAGTENTELNILGMALWIHESK